MQYSREQYSKFLNMELCAVTEEYDKLFSASAKTLLNDMEELFIGVFLKMDGGEMVVKFSGTRAFPRKGEYRYAMYLPCAIQDYSQWDGVTYEDLYKQRLKGSEAVCVWQAKSREPGYVLAGFRHVDVDFANYMSCAPGALLFFGPNRPPIEYLANLYEVVQDKESEGVCSVLDKEKTEHRLAPELIRDYDASGRVYGYLNSKGTIILQGPPGTGKTQLIAEMVRRCCDVGKSVLVTALTNRALLEIAEKDALSGMLEDGRVLKVNLKSEEQEELKKLQNAKAIVPVLGSVVMSTFYITSGFAAELPCESAFDYVIMDEASQALLPMFAAAKKIGRYNLWVGDTAQLPPVVSLNEDIIKENQFNGIVNGLQYVVESNDAPVYQLTRSYRFGSRAASYTGVFYNGTLTSALIGETKSYHSLNFLDYRGGPTLILTDMAPGDATPDFAMDMISFIVGSILHDDKNADISVLTCLKRTTRSLQKAIAVRLGLANEIIIETIARIQGLTSDVTIFLIPNVSLIRSLEPHLFNVATSRAKWHTIIIADKNVLKFPLVNPLVSEYLSRLQAERCIYVPASKSRGNVNSLLGA